MRLIARAEQSSQRLSLKLEQRGFDRTVVKTVVSGLLDQDLVNDERYARLWIRSRLCSRTKAPSPRDLQISLANKGIDRDSSKKALEAELDEENEYALLLRYLEKTEPENQGPSLRSQLRTQGFSASILNIFFDSL